ncbi:hypothetical protein DVH05_000585 [Phytophthora capsici]|nr:hypothetical protein DVH05_000585 [Phytophthora capsici]|eukprot:jgi/Phyca11/19651/fgenesh1_pg.PHYCAscaffold_50_\
MRFSYFLLLTSAAILSNSNATATVSGEGHVMTSADAPARALETNNGKRSLRYYAADEDDKYDQKNGKYDDDEEEERNFTAAQLAKWTEKAESWVSKNRTPAYIKDKLTGMNGLMTAENRKKYELFTAAYGRANPHALDRL